MNHLPPGFLYQSHFISKEEEAVLLNEITRLKWQKVELFGRIAKREVVHFGLDYTYHNRKVSPTIGLPEWSNFLISRVANYLQLSEKDIAELLITKYLINAGIGWHRDAPVFDKVVGISLLNPCVLRLRSRVDHKNQYKIELEAGSCYLLSNEARWNWEHSIFPLKNPRYSMTLRTLKLNK
ncbi:Uncharacterised protein [Legionella wadsworthii]|uniref:Fe2OG dioxygenase domain-containing protein n=1 Tax=Legionella wadsworthii TaxID=28088 RepID=A0A378LPJ0_9GAMM|nr:alpha-ketoglutarate-dependent dioxygenase AlkB [Legionella wadsworthii]STY28846.1 Uncharacterised protein [Legionella wadsworthii]